MPLKVRLIVGGARVGSTRPQGRHHPLYSSAGSAVEPAHARTAYYRATWHPYFHIYPMRDACCARRAILARFLCNILSRYSRCSARTSRRYSTHPKTANGMRNNGHCYHDRTAVDSYFTVSQAQPHEPARGHTLPASCQTGFECPIHGEIILPDEVLPLLTTRPMRRLKGLKQLGACSMVRWLCR
jgi:hypothetical protein